MTADPTWIAMHVDPRLERFEGIAAHGDTPFSVPFISEIDHNLHMGGCTNGLVLPTDIKHVISLYPWERYQVKHELETFAEFRLYDSDGHVDSPRVRAIAQLALRCAEHAPTLIHCQAGLNRSSLITAYVLMLRGHTALSAIEKIRHRRSTACLCNTTFERWLHKQSPH